MMGSGIRNLFFAEVRTGILFFRRTTTKNIKTASAATSANLHLLDSSENPDNPDNP